MSVLKKSSKGFGCGLLFLLPFAAVGLGMAGWSYYAAAEWLQMQGWVPTPATLKTLKLANHRDADGDSNSIEGSFQYENLGQTFTSERMALFGGSDNIGSFQKRNYRQLKPLLNVPNGVTCYVNPADSSDAVLIRTARWEMFTFISLFACIFGSVGVLGFVAMLSMWRTARVSDIHRANSPDEPWQWNPRWREGRISSGQRESVSNWTRYSIWWLICTLPPVYFGGRELLSGNAAALVSFILPVGTVLIVRGMLNRRSQLRRFGEAHIQISDLPLYANLNTTLAVVFSKGELPHGPVSTKLTCECTVSTGESSSTETTYEDNQKIEVSDCRIISDGLCIAVPVNIPPHAKTTSVDDNSIAWKLNVTVPTAGRPIQVEFELPVFRP